MNLLFAALIFLPSPTGPRFTRALVCPCPNPVPGLYFQWSRFWGAAIGQPVKDIAVGSHVGPLTWRAVQPNDPEVRVDADGNLYSKNGQAGLYVEWQEPATRKALLFCYAKRFVINGRTESGHINGWDIHQLVPVNLRKGTNSYLSTGAAFFQLLPVKAAITFLPDMATVPDARPGEDGPFVASIVAVNATAAAKRVKLKAEVDGGPITLSLTESIPAMDSRIVRFDFRTSSQLKPGAHHLRLFGEGIDPCTMDFSVAGAGLPRRCTYISRFDGMVRGYSVLESLTSAPGQPIVSFTYGGGHTSLSNLQYFKAKSWCHIVSPEFRTLNWDGLGRRDATEALDVATKRLKADRHRIYLLGHSMGGHGVYQMAALNPKAFAGIALSAGWLSDFTYMSEAYPEIITADPVAKMFRRAMGEVDLEKRLDDLASVKNVWMVHGDRDRSVPINESYRIKNELERRGAKVGIFVQPGADHSWELPNGGGNQYDFPPLFEALRTSTRRGTGDLWGGSQVPPFWAECMEKACVAVYGTHGSAVENQEARDRARQEAVVARVRFQVDCEVLPDTATPEQIAGRNVILFGTPQSNRLWKHHPTAAKLLARAQKKGKRFTSWMIQSRRGKQIWSAIGGVDAPGCRLAYLFDPDDSYRRYPQWILFSRSVLTNGLKGVVGAGFAGGPEAWR